ncbi:hypothetical protein [Streptomyces sp. NPDC086787]|uniref:hypothetical protein n=1 Tax=Streptomyces sp. NPDC086787 TaxID=3365759 RepID=UPI00380FA6B8
MPAKRVSLSLTTALAVVTALTGAAPAFADNAGPIGIGTARTVSGEHGDFTVPAWTDAAGASLSSVTATIRDEDGVVAGPLALTGQNGHWSLPDDELLKLTEDGGPMPHLGRYAIDITAADDQGHTATRTGAGALDFTLRPEFVADDGGFGALAQSVVPDFEHPDTAVTGRLVGVQPGSRDLVPLDGRTVEVVRDTDRSAAADGTRSLTTDTDGRFTTGDFTVTGATSVTARFSEDSTDAHGTADAVRGVNIQRRAVYVTASADRTRVLPGQTVTVSGVVRTGTAANSPVVTGASVVVGLDKYHGGKSLTLTAGADGRFTAELSPAASSHSVEWYAMPSGPFLYGGDATGPLAVPAEGVFRKVSSSLSANGRVTVSGRLGETYGVGDLATDEPVLLEYSHDGRTGWTKLATLTAHSSGSGSGPAQFTMSAWGYSDGYYRVHHLASDALAEAASAPVRLHRTETRVASMKASATKVRKNTVVTVSGTLQEYPSTSWRAYKGQHVELFFQKKGSKQWTYLASGTTDSAGRVKLKGKATVDGVWLIQYFGDATHFNSDGNPVFVDVR